MITRGMLLWRFRSRGSDLLSKDELARDAHRAYILALAGFSFTGLIALAVLDQALRRSFTLAVLFLLISFMAFLSALNFQSYKARRWEDDVATTTTDIASLSMFLAVFAVLFADGLTLPAAIVASIGTALWLIDHAVRLSIQWRYRKELS